MKLPPVSTIHVQSGMGDMGQGGAGRPPPGGGGPRAPQVPPQYMGGGQAQVPFAGYPFGGAQQLAYHQQSQYPAGGSQSNANLFSATTDVPLEIIAAQYGVIVAKSDRQEGTEEGRRIFQDATKGIDPKLGVPKQYVRNVDGEADSGNETQDRHIQDLFTTNLHKLECINRRLEEYDMKRVFLISSFKVGVNLAAIDNISSIWEGDQIDLMLYWDRITFEHVCYWQLCCNMRVPLDSEDRTSMKWALIFIKASCSPDLQARIAMRYDTLHRGYQGAITYMWCILDFLFAMSDDQKHSLKNYFKIFAKEGLKKVKGESVPTVSVTLLAAARRLESVGELDSEQVKYLLEGLSKCSQPEFAKIFEAKHTEYSAHNILPSGGTRCWTNLPSSWHEFFFLIHLALTHHGTLTTTPGRWNVPKKGFHNLQELQRCWNCGADGHKIPDCPKKKDKKAINKHRKEYYEKKKQSAGGGPGRGGGAQPPQQGGGGGRGRGRGRGSQSDGNYSRDKWAPPEGEVNVLWHNGEPYHYCSICRKAQTGHNGSGWNMTHDSKHHKLSQQDGFTVLGTLAAVDPQNKLVLAVRNNQPRVPPLVASPGSVTETSASTMTGATLNTQPPMIGALRNHAHGFDMFNQYHNRAPSEEIKKYVELMRTGFGFQNPNP